MTTKVIKKFNREQLINDLVGSAICCVTERAYYQFEGDEEETINAETELEHNGDIIGSINYEIYSRCTYHGNRYTNYYEPPDEDEYDFFYEDINVEINRENGKIVTNLSEEINQRLHKNRDRQLN